MDYFMVSGKDIRNLAKSLVLEFMKNTPECQVGKEGLKQSQIFKQCGLDWGSYPVATSSNQQYWLVALLWKLNEEKKVEQVTKSGPWRLL